MNFSLDTNNQRYLISSYGDDYFIVNQKKYTGDLYISNSDIKLVDLEAMDSLLPDELLNEVIQLKPEILIVGTGKNHRLADKNLFIQMVKNNIALEVMSTDAACRTYNVLVSDERSCMAIFHRHDKEF